MSRRSEVRQRRHEDLLKLLNESPFLTDGELAESLNVSIATIRLDRTALNIPELRERVLSVAHEQTAEPHSAGNAEIMDIEEGIRGISVLHTDESMCFPGTRIVRSQYLYTMAEDLVTTTAGFRAALINVANIKYKIPVGPDCKLIARSELKSVRKDSCVIWVSIYCERKEIFRAKYILNGEVKTV